MPYDVTIITVKPNTHLKALPGVEQWLADNRRKGEFIGCLTSEIGDLNKILLLHHYDDEVDLAADRVTCRKAQTRYGCLELICGMSSDTFVQFPFLPPIKPGQYGPIFEVRTYLLKPTGLPPTIAAWTKPRRRAEALPDPRRDVFDHRRRHPLPAYLALSGPRRPARRRGKPQ